MLKVVASCISTQLRTSIMLGYTRCNIVILTAATAWLTSFSSCIECGLDSYTVLFKCPQRKFLPLPPHPVRGEERNFLWGHLKSTVYELNPHTMQELKDNVSH